MKFSVIIPLYNKAAYISKAIQSVLDQNDTEFELIIVNDGSTDGSLGRVHEFDDSRIRIIEQSNAGVSVARNNGVKVAQNEYIAFLDADDWWAREYLGEMKKLIIKYPDAGLWAAKYYKVRFGKNIVANIGLEDGFAEGYINYFKVYAKTLWMPITSSSFIIPRKVFNKYNGFNSKLHIGEDFYLWAQVALTEQIAYINIPLVFYNQDVNTFGRATGGYRIYKPEQHYIFNTEHLLNSEQTNPDLKNLLDKLRLRALYRYRIRGAYKNDVRKVLSHVNFSEQDLSWRIKYSMPPAFLRFWIYMKKKGSVAKSRMNSFKTQ